MVFLPLLQFELDSHCVEAEREVPQASCMLLLGNRPVLTVVATTLPWGPEMNIVQKVDFRLEFD